MISDDLETNIKRIFLPSAERQPLEYFFQSSSLLQPLPSYCPGCWTPRMLLLDYSNSVNSDFRALVMAECGYEHEPNLKILNNSTRPCNGNEILKAHGN